MIIVTRSASDVNAYQQVIQSPWWHKVRHCPHCHARMHGHGSYLRYADDLLRCQRIPIRRYRCPRCRVTFSYPPSFLRPFRSLLVHLQEWAALLWALGGRSGAWGKSWGGLWTPSGATCAAGRTRHLRC